MAGFIDEVAESLYHAYGTGISSLNVLFPSRRARLFFEEALSGQLAESDTPVWQPAFVSIDELMQRVSGIGIGDRLRLTVELYKVYARYHEESFDRFYHWGEMLLADFDAIDNYLIDARRLFVNIDDLKQIENRFDFLTDEQKEVVGRFWSVFSTGQPSAAQQDFLTIWNTLYDIYTGFREALLQKGFGYKGMVYRHAAGRMKNNETEWFAGEKFAVAGFNALSNTERELFLYLRDHCECRFFWDYDDYYGNDPVQEAGLFIRRNLKDFPDALAGAKRDYFTEPKRIVTVDAPSNALQSRYTAQFLKEIIREQGFAAKETAIVLTDENLLPAVLYAMPDAVETFNVTMGYALRLTPAYSLTEYLISLQRNKKIRNGILSFYHKDVEGILSHPYVAGLFSTSGQAESLRRIIAGIHERQQAYVDESLFAGHDMLPSIFRNISGQKALSDYLTEWLTLAGNETGDGYPVQLKREYLYRIIESIHRLSDIIDECGVPFSERVFLLSLRKILHGQKVVFEGEPLVGVQVMGILETRSLDFDNVLLLSANEMNFPGTLYASSFIPANLRFAYGLPTVQYHEAMYAYYFYRLLQRARHIHIVYNSKDTEMDTGEPSRFIHQLRYESPHEIQHRHIRLNVAVEVEKPVRIEKDGTVWDRLSEYTDGRRCLSPSAFNHYMECPLRFCFKYVIGAEEKEELAEGVDARKFGNIFHSAVRNIYEQLRDRPEAGPVLEAMLKDDGLIEKAVWSSIAEELNMPQGDYSGGIRLMAGTVKDYIRRIMAYDATQLKGTISGLEEEIRGSVMVSVNGKPATVTLAGKIDRIDALENGMVRIIDYKTGSMKQHLSCSGIESLFDRGGDRLNGVALQLLIYSFLYHRKTGRDVHPSVYFIRGMHDPHYNGSIRVGETEVSRFSVHAGHFEKVLSEKIAELLDKTIPFVQTENTGHCAYCSFGQLCGR